MIAPYLQRIDFLSLVQSFTGRLLNTAVEGIVLAGLIWLFVRMVGRQNSRTRFAVWFSALLTFVALPFAASFNPGSSHLQVQAATALSGKLTLSSRWGLCLFSLWVLGAGLLLLRLAIGLQRLHRLRSSCCRVDLATLAPEIGDTIRGSHRRVTLCISGEVAVPAAIGFFHPVIVFPEWLLSQVSTEELKTILLHELAHLARWDDWTNLAQQIAKAVFFFHPAVWWIDSHLTLEREMACDDAVLAQTASARDYASSLISFAEKLHNARGLALAQSLVSRVHQLSDRIVRILDSKRPSRTRLWKPAVGLSAGLLMIVFGATPYAPRLVSFGDRISTSQSRQIPARQTDALSGNATLAGKAPMSATDVPVAHKLVRSMRPKSIPAAVPRIAAASLRFGESSPHTTPLVPAMAMRQAVPVRATFVILQTTQHDASGTEIWTLCIWKVGGQMADRNLQSEIVLSLI
ncbi:MAG TPA: M56 family metallopeptidase [Candidatus Sulfotelmatobacter sp.]